MNRLSDRKGCKYESDEIKKARRALMVKDLSMPEWIALLEVTLRAHDRMVDINRNWVDSYKTSMEKPGFVDMAGGCMAQAYDESNTVPSLTRKEK
jgi:hypothetical protein